MRCEVFGREADAEGEGGPLEPPQRRQHPLSFLSIRMRAISGPTVSAEEQVDCESDVRWASTALGEMWTMLMCLSSGEPQYALDGENAGESVY